MPRKRKVGRPRKKTTKRKSRSKGESVITAGVLGQEARRVILSKTTTAQEVADQLNFGSVKTVKASKNGTTNFKEIKLTDKVNGYKAILYIPAVSGGQ